MATVSRATIVFVFASLGKHVNELSDSGLERQDPSAVSKKEILTQKGNIIALINVLMVEDTHTCPGSHGINRYQGFLGFFFKIARKSLSKREISQYELYNDGLSNSVRRCQSDLLEVGSFPG